MRIIIESETQQAAAIQSQPYAAGISAAVMASADGGSAPGGFAADSTEPATTSEDMLTINGGAPSNELLAAVAAAGDRSLGSPAYSNGATDAGPAAIR